MSNIEILDLVDENDTIMATLSRGEIYDKNLKYVRVLEAFIRNDRGELWIPTRTSDKQIAPNGYDIGVGGHVEHGETYDAALAKEVREELGWDIADMQFRQLGKFGPKDGLNTVTMLYEITAEDAPELNPEDFTSAEWMPPHILAKRIAAGHPAKSNILPLLQLAYRV